MSSNDDFHSLEVQSALEMLKSRREGISNREAALRLQEYGRNEIPEKEKESPLVLFLKQFKSALIYILIVAAAISYAFDHMIDVYVIVTVIFINATMGFIQEYRAERSIAALKSMIVPLARVYRDSELSQMGAAELVPGDVISLEEGDRVPADARLLECRNLRTVEASLTGESFPVDKMAAPLPAKTRLSDRSNMVWLGTFIASGSAKAVVTATGMNTALGSIAKDIQGMAHVRGDFEKKTDRLALQMGGIAFFISIVTFAIGFFHRGFEFKDILLFTIASLVSGIPEGLPAVLVIVLALGAHHMAKKNAIIRHLPAMDAIGAVTVIVTDKTGTLTLNMMTVKSMRLCGGAEVIVGGRGWEPEGGFSRAGSPVVPLEEPDLDQMMHIAVVCNGAKIVREDGRHTVIGDPTEGALIVLAEKAGLRREAAMARDRILDELPFSSELKFRAALVRRNGERMIYAVGAPEVMLERSSRVLRAGTAVPIQPGDRESVLRDLESLAGGGMRAIALCYSDCGSKGPESISEKSVERMVFVGMVGMVDPPRPEVKEAVAQAKRAGIRVMMATGDHKITAVAIAKDVGILEDGSPSEVMTGEEVMSLSDAKLAAAVARVKVFARLSPHSKLRIAEALQKQGHIVAMTGDGVNDAPALKRADAGISMGLSGTDVARESSDIVLADDNFASIVKGVEEGRVVFRNIRQTSFFLVTTNFAEGGLIISTMLLGFPLPLLPTQILWLNLVTAGVSDVALATERSHGEVLDEPPRKRGTGILSAEYLPFLLVLSTIIAAVAVAVFAFLLPDGEDRARTGAFLAIAFCELFNLLNMRSLRKSIFDIGIFSNKYVLLSLAASLVMIPAAIYHPFLQGVFQFVPPEPMEIVVIAALSSSVLWAGEAYKFAKRKVRSAQV